MDRTRLAPHNDPARVAQLNTLLSRSSVDPQLADTLGIPAGTPEAADLVVFQRLVASYAPTLDLAVPAWGRGAAVAHSVGPFDAATGQPVWFDFYRRVRLVSLFVDGDPQPVMLFGLLEFPRALNAPIPVGVASQRNRHRYQLAAGSVWIRADRLAAVAPAGTYVGLRVSGGTLDSVPPPVDSGGRLTIPAGGRATVELSLAPAGAIPGGGAQAGRDAADAGLVLPATVSFVLAADHVGVSGLAGASWRLYGQAVDFTWQAGSAGVFEPALQSVRVPMTLSVADVHPVAVASPFATPSGRAPSRVAGWVLPVATIDVNHPIEASGAGGLAVACGTGLSLSWAGLDEGPVALPSPWVALWPGLIQVTDDQASNRYAGQTLRLWADGLVPQRSRLDVHYADSFPLSYWSAAAGSETLHTSVAVDGSFDRPMDVRGVPLPVHTQGSQFLIEFTDALSWVVLFDDHILLERLDPAFGWPARPGETLSLALRNALFTTTPVNGVLLVATLRDPETVNKGALVLGLGLYELLPTLPDPYAANVGGLAAGRQDRGARRQVIQILIATVEWTKAAADAGPDQVALGFAFEPVAVQADTFERWTLAAGDRSAPNPTHERATVSLGGFSDPIWNRVFGRFGREQFALLDVSTNADQMGVGFQFFGQVSREDFAFYQVFGVTDSGDGTGQAVVPLQVQALDLSAESRYVRAFTLPQVSWEPLLNLTTPDDPSLDPPIGRNLFPDDGGPTRLFNDSTAVVPIEPAAVMKLLKDDFDQRPDGFTGALFTLLFGLYAFARFTRLGQAPSRTNVAAALSFNAPSYQAGDLVGGLQLRVDAPGNDPESPIFEGGTRQADNLLDSAGSPSGSGTLGKSVGEIFNGEFFSTSIQDRGVPLTRIDFSGYGASIFSHWENPNAAIAATSKAYFDVFVGRTGLEVIQVRSIVYPWAVHVVRTITMFRTSSGCVYRYDSGWQAESPGIYDFSYTVYLPGNPPRPTARRPGPYEFHPGIVKGVWNVRNIHETTAVPKFHTSWAKAIGATYLDNDGVEQTVSATTPAEFSHPEVDLQPITFDADVQIDGVVSGARGKLVPSQGMLGFVQLAPRGEPIPANLFAQLLGSQFGALGGPVDCVVDVAASGQKMRLGRVDVNASVGAAGNPIFVTAGRGPLTVPKDGWSVVQHNQGSGEVTPLDAQTPVPVIRRGKLLDPIAQTTDAVAADLHRIANPIDLVRPLGAASRNYGLLQSTGTQKALFRLPSFQQGVDLLLGAAPDFADAYRLINSSAIFPNVADAVSLALGTFQTQIIDQGFKLLDPTTLANVLHMDLPEGPLMLINKTFLKLYVEYAPKDKNGNSQGTGTLDYGFDSAAASTADQWLSKVNDISMVVDLGPLTRVITIKGRFEAEKGAAPAFHEPTLEFSDVLKPVIDILQVLEALSTGDYAGAFQKGLDVAMSNGADSWSYAFHTRQEIPVVKFPPEPEYSTSAVDPLKLEAHMSVGVYFNEALQITADPTQLIPSAGAFMDFGGSLSVMCVSLAAATVYAVGSVDLQIAADIKTGPSLHMNFGFGAEVLVGLPVVGGVSLLYMVGVEIDLDTGSLTVGASLLFRGRAELLGGLVTVQIQIEAKGTVQRQLGSGQTTLAAQVTFGLDISIFLVINISFSQSWQESRQIA